jgi:hypothetical protein
MTQARLRTDTPGGEVVAHSMIASRPYEVVTVMGEGILVVQDDRGDTFIVEYPSDLQPVEICCDFCGTWSTHAGPSPADDDWRCYGGTGPCGAVESSTDLTSPELT